LSAKSTEYIKDIARYLLKGKAKVIHNNERGVRQIALLAPKSPKGDFQNFVQFVVQPRKVI
jgi:hypothetical protein